MSPVASELLPLMMNRLMYSVAANCGLVMLNCRKSELWAVAVDGYMPGKVISY